MGLTLEQRKAKRLYASGAKAEEIAEKLEVSQSTVYRWIKNPEFEFEEAKKIAEFTTEDMEEMLTETHKKILISIADDPLAMKDPKVADALIKVANVVDKLEDKKQRELERELRQEESKRGVVFVDDIKDYKED